MFIDGHVHIVGDGSAESGCRLNLKGLRKIEARFLLQQIGLPQKALRGGLDQLYLDKLLGLIKESSLDSAVILANDEAYDSAGCVLEGASMFYVPNDYVLRLAREYDCFIPAVSIHPARVDALEELEKCIEGGARILKCLPNCQNIDLLNENYLPFCERMAQAGIIFLCHTGGEFSLPVIKSEYANPSRLRLPLECGVTVIAAHCGTSAGFEKNSFYEFKEMLTEFPNLYGDNSGLNTPLRSKHLRLLLDPTVQSRLVYGSDFPIPVSGFWAGLRQLISLSSYYRLRKIANPLELDYQLKREIGFSEETFTRLEELLKT